MEYYSFRMELRKQFRKGKHAMSVTKADIEKIKTLNSHGIKWKYSIDGRLLVDDISGCNDKLYINTKDVTDMSCAELMQWLGY